MDMDDSIINSLREREKELNCLYRIDEVLSNNQLSLPEIFEEIIRIIPSGWRFPELCSVRIVINGSCYQTPGFYLSLISEKCNIKVNNKIEGYIEVVYVKDIPETKEGYFLEKESKLIRTIADRIGQMLVYRRMRMYMEEWQLSKQNSAGAAGEYKEWEIIINLFRHTDTNILLHVCRKLVNYLLLNGIGEASEMNCSVYKSEDLSYVNYPTSMEPIGDRLTICEKAFNIAKKHLSDDEITAKVKKWIQESNTYSLVKAINSTSSSLRDIIEEVKKYQKIIQDNEITYSPQERWISVCLINKFLSDRSDYINIAKHYLNCRDFFDIIDKIITPVVSHGKLGGKGSGLFLAQKILEKESENSPLLKSIKIPKTWYIVSDVITKFLQYNDLEELNEQKYKEIQEVRIEYPNIVQLIKNSKLPPEIMKSLSVVLDDFGEVPIIVRSSSVLEDQIGTAFSGKYKSLFLANQGSKQKRLKELEDAILEVYASVFSPDPIQYRKERGLLDCHEEMGILIQEVVGKRVGKYFMPLFSGVAFSNNEYRWSPRIKREDGLVRVVPGLGTRAVDRLSDDFPVMISPGQPGLSVNMDPEEIKKYSPKKADVINLDNEKFETVDINAILKEYGNSIDNIDKIVSVLEFNHIKNANRFEIDFEKDDLVVTFNGIISKSPYIKQIKKILEVLHEKTELPMDIEFASDGFDLYLLQCRPQSFSVDKAPAPIPGDIPAKDIIFSANRYVSNGTVNNITHIVYVNPEEYSKVNELSNLFTIGKVIGLLNTTLPRRQFILMGPGRWGSRGDIKLGVKAGYADLCNTAVLIEIAAKKAGYLPELSFGTHFFQDLVEANIHYLPLYPDDKETVFNTNFLLKEKNILKDIFPEYECLEDVIRVIDIPGSTLGRVLNIAMNSELGEAVGYLSSHTSQIKVKEAIDYPNKGHNKFNRKLHDEQFGKLIKDESAWRWRFHMIEKLASRLDSNSFGVQAAYLFGSTNNGTAGPGSDIDLIIHFNGTEQQRDLLHKWLEGWSQSLAEANYLKTGYKMDGLLDVHIITDEDIKNRNSFAMKIDSITDPAYRLKLKT